MNHVVVIGAGQTAAAFAAKLRSLAFGGRITLVGDESALPYQRPPLSKSYLKGDVDEAALWLRSENFWREKNVSLVLGRPVTGIGLEDRVVEIQDERLHFDSLVLATGASPRRLPANLGGDLPGVFVLRTLADVANLRRHFEPSAHLAVIGGGYVGLEVAATARELGLEVTVVEAGPRILQRVASPETSAYFRRLHEAHGVTIIENAKVASLLGEEYVTGVHLEGGRVVTAEVVVVGIGVVPNDSLAKAAGIVTENGIRTDQFGRTSAEGVWAAGDCASFPSVGQQLRIESVGNAVEHGELVAENILGANREYIPRPWFWSDQFEARLQIAGLNTGYDLLVNRGGPDGPVSFWYFKRGTLLAVDAINDPRAYAVGKRLIETQRHVDPTLLADPQFDLRQLQRA